MKMPVRIFRSLSLFLILPALLALHSCQSVKDVADNTGRNFSEPRKLKDKLKDPLKDSVELSVIWVGHATALIRIDDKVILTDPLFTNNVAQVLRRYMEPGIVLDDLRRCDMILISHSHMDHMNLGSLKMLEEKFPGIPLVFPEGAEEFIPNYDFEYVRFRTVSGMNKKYVGETKIVGGVKITSVAAYHWGGRYGVDGKLWEMAGACGFIIEYNGKTVYYSGDTSYEQDFFRYLGENYKIDLQIIPIIYCDNCEDVNHGGSHLFPLGLLKIADDTKALKTIPVHYGTFTDPENQYPVLEAMLLKDEDYKERIVVLRLGKQLIVYEANNGKQKGSPGD